MNTFRRFLGLLALTGLVACGGGGGSSTPLANFDGYEIPGVGNGGAPIVGATVFVEDSNNSKTVNCGNTDEGGKFTCKVPATYTPPFAIYVVPADVVSPNQNAPTALKTIVLRPKKGTGPNDTLPVTPLTTLLVNSDWNYYGANKKDLNTIETRLIARKKQIDDALANVTAQILKDKAKSFDFLTDTSSLPSSNEGSDLLLDNIDVDFKTFKVALKNGTKTSVTFQAETEPTKSPVTPISVVTSDIVEPTQKSLKDFAGVYDINITFTSYHADGTISAGTQTLYKQLSLYNDGTFDVTYNSTRWSGKYTLNTKGTKGTSVKITGTVGGADSNGNLVGSIDNTFNMKLAYHTSGSGNNTDTTTGSVVSTHFTGDPTLTRPAVVKKALADFAGTYNLTANWTSTGGDSGSEKGTVVVGSSGSVSSCSVGIFVICTGNLTLKSDGSGANFSINAQNNASGTISGTLSGSVNNSFAVTGSLSGTSHVDNGNYTLTGTITGNKN